MGPTHVLTPKGVVLAALYRAYYDYSCSLAIEHVKRKTPGALQGVVRPIRQAHEELTRELGDQLRACAVPDAGERVGTASEKVFIWSGGWEEKVFYSLKVEEGRCELQVIF